MVLAETSSRLKISTMAMALFARCRHGLPITMQYSINILFIVFILISSLNTQVAAQGTHGFTLMIAPHKTGSSFLDMVEKPPLSTPYPLHFK